MRMIPFLLKHLPRITSFSACRAKQRVSSYGLEPKEPSPISSATTNAAFLFSLLDGPLQPNRQRDPYSDDTTGNRYTPFVASDSQAPGIVDTFSGTPTRIFVWQPPGRCRTEFGRIQNRSHDESVRVVVKRTFAEHQCFPRTFSREAMRKLLGRIVERALLWL